VIVLLPEASVTTTPYFPMHKGKFSPDRRVMQYAYEDGDGYVFIDTDNPDPRTLPRALVRRHMLYMKEGASAVVLLHDGVPIGLELPPQVELTVAEIEREGPDDSSATMETNLKVNVPPCIGAGAIIRIDTRTGEYLGRVPPSPPVWADENR
jgi:elongation factor P